MPHDSRRAGPGRAIDMAEVAAGIKPVAHALLDRPRIGKAAVGIAFPNRLFVVCDEEDTAGSGHERHFAEIGSKRRQYLLRKPSRAHEPLALRAIGDDDPRFRCSHCKAV